MSSPTFGLIFNEVNNDPTPPILSDFAIGAIVVPSDDANPTVFPLNQPVAVNTGDAAVLIALGTGPLYKAVQRVNAQLADLEVSAQVVVVRVATGRNPDATENVAQTIANIVGDPAAGTGLYALLKAPQACNLTPRLIIAPGYTGRLTNAVVAPVVTAQGAGYTHPIVTFNPAGATATATVDGTGKITAINLTNPGDYELGVTPTITITDSQGGPGAGATASLSIELLANPICAAMPPVLAKLLAHALVGGPGKSKQDALNWRGTLNSQRLIPQDDWEIIADGTGTAYIDGAARSLGLAIRTDFINSGYPFNAWANLPVQGALGMKRVDGFSLVDGATDGQELLAAGIGVTVRGDLSDTSLDDSGYVAVSYRNASSDPLTYFYNKNRGRDFTNVALLKSIRKRLGKENITRQDVNNVLDDMAAINIELLSKNKLVGFTVGFKTADNTVEGLRAGKFTVYDNTEEPAPIVQITINRGLDRAALSNELEQFQSIQPITD